MIASSTWSGCGKASSPHLSHVVKPSAWALPAATVFVLLMCASAMSECFLCTIMPASYCSSAVGDGHSHHSLRQAGAANPDLYDLD